MPALETLEIMKLVNCPETFTPDMRCIMGESPLIQGYFVLAGMNSAGLSFGGGAGKCDRECTYSRFPHRHGLTGSERMVKTRSDASKCVHKPEPQVKAVQRESSVDYADMIEEACRAPPPREHKR